MISHYRIIEKIGSGGMGEVYLAEDTKLNRQVALKFLPTHLCQDADCRARFKREAQAAAKLDHPNIVSVHEVGEHQGRPFFSMQHVEGQSLREVAVGKPMPIERILEIGIQVCDGLQAAHDKGITHRDIKPSNILIDSHGRARIVDFGLASVLGTEQLTKTGSTLGTIGYMSPEQVHGDKVDHRTDLFSLGVVLYELITGHSPFKAETEAATLHAITTTKPELLARYRREVPSELQMVIDKALEKDVAKRYQHADELATDLKRLAVRGQVQAGSSPRNTRTRRPVIAAAALFAVLLGVAIVFRFFLSGGEQTVDHKKMLAVLPLENIGPAEEEYFADGLTDEITTKLSGLSGLRVVARSSAMQYKKTTKTIKQIGNELGVGYLLQGTIRWAQSPDGGQHLRVNPQLIEVTDGAQVWSQSYEGALAGVFKMQSDIATQVAQALGVALLSTEQRTIEAKPTNNTEAYEYYLRGLQLWGRFDREAIEASLAMYQKAVDLDPAFATAYWHLAFEHLDLYWSDYDKSDTRLKEAKRAVDKVIELQPTSVDADLAQGYYYYFGFRDYDRALGYFHSALNKSPSNSVVLTAIGYVKRRQGMFLESIDMLQRSILLDPRALDLPFELGITFLALRDYAKAEEYFHRANILDPENFWNWEFQANLYIGWRGDTKAARAVLHEGIIHVDSLKLSRSFWNLDLLDGDYAAAERHLPGMLLTCEADTAGYYFGEAWTARLTGQPAVAEAHFDSLRLLSEKRMKANPGQYSFHSRAGLAYAGLGRKEDAVREGKKAVDLMPLSKDAFDEGPGALYNLALIYSMVGDQDAAIGQLEQLLSVPNTYSANSIRLEPYWIPLRSNPRFQKLLEKYGT